MNTLSLKITTDNWHRQPCFEFLVDGKPLSEWLDDDNEGIVEAPPEGMSLFAAQAAWA